MGYAMYARNEVSQEQRVRDTNLRYATFTAQWFFGETGFAVIQQEGPEGDFAFSVLCLWRVWDFEWQTTLSYDSFWSRLG